MFANWYKRSCDSVRTQFNICVVHVGTLNTNNYINKMTSLSRTIGVGILLGAACHVHSKIIVDIERIHLDSDQEFLNMTGNVRKTGDGVSVVDLSIDMHHNVGATVFVRIQNVTRKHDLIIIKFHLYRLQIESEIFIRNKEGYKSFLKGPPIDICTFFANPHLNPMLAVIMNAMNKYGNKMTSCPIGKVNTNCLKVLLLMYYVHANFVHSSSTISLDCTWTPCRRSFRPGNIASRWRHRVKRQLVLRWKCWCSSIVIRAFITNRVCVRLV